MGKPLPLKSFWTMLLLLSHVEPLLPPTAAPPLTADRLGTYRWPSQRTSWKWTYPGRSKKRSVHDIILSWRSQLCRFLSTQLNVWLSLSFSVITWINHYRTSLLELPCVGYIWRYLLLVLRSHWLIVWYVIYFEFIYVFTLKVCPLCRIPALTFFKR